MVQITQLIKQLRDRIHFFILGEDVFIEDPELNREFQVNESLGDQVLLQSIDLLRVLQIIFLNGMALAKLPVALLEGDHHLF